MKTFRERSPVIVGIISILGITAMMFFAFSINNIPVLKQAYEIKAEFADAAGLNPENQVRVAGLKVGAVRSVELTGDRVTVTMEIDRGIDLPEDARAEIKLATILGTKFVDIQGKAGDGPFMDAGTTIPLDRTRVPYEIYQAANEGTAVLEDLDGEALNKALAQLATLVEESREEVKLALRNVNALAGDLNSRNRDLTSLLTESDDLTALLSDQGDELNRLIDSSDAVLGSLASQREEVQSVLDSTRMMAGELTSLLRDNRSEVDAILTKLHRALKVLDDNVEHLDVAFEYAGPSSRYFALILQQGRWADIYTCALVQTTLCEFGE